VLVFLGLGAVHVAVLTGALSGLWQVAIVWGVGVTLAVFLVGAVSGAHINPAITVALAVWGRHRRGDVAVYVVAQVAGAFAAAACLFLLFGPFLDKKERDKGVTRGHGGSEITAMCYNCHFPSPGPIGDAAAYDAEKHRLHNELTSEPAACVGEFLATALLALVVFGVADPRNAAAPPSRLAPAFVGLAVAGLVAIMAPLTQACLNPARDFGPRLFAALAGWGRIALPGPRGLGFLTVYILSPTVGAVVGGAVWCLLLAPRLPDPPTDKDAAP
jgi:glycerol uptake facilitator protein